MLILVDSGILLRLLERTDPQHGVIRDAVRALRGRGETLVTAPQNASEFWNVCTRPATARGGFGLSITDADRRLRFINKRIQEIHRYTSADVHPGMLSSEIVRFLVKRGDFGPTDDV